MFPVSACTPKESLPLLDVPLLTHLILEAKAAGVERLHVVTSPSKSFDALLEDRGTLHTHRSHLDPSLFHATEGLEVFTHLQHEPKGVGNALEAALDAVEGVDEEVAALFDDPNSVFDGEGNYLGKRDEICASGEMCDC